MLVNWNQSESTKEVSTNKSRDKGTQETRRMLLLTRDRMKHGWKDRFYIGLGVILERVYFMAF